MEIRDLKCRVCGKAINSSEAVTCFHQDLPDGSRLITDCVHTACEDSVLRCAGCGRELGEDEQRLADDDEHGHMRCWHRECAPSLSITEEQSPSKGGQ